MIRLAAEVLAAFPETRITVLVVDGLRADRPWPETDRAIADLEAAYARQEWTPYDETTPEIAGWHDAYRAFGTNPRRIRPSVDALGRRMAKTGALPRVHPAVDAYNLISVRSGIPSGAFDLDRVPGEIVIRLARPTDRFTPLGEPDTVELPRPGEVVYACGDQVLTRHWNHRDADQTKVTTDSKRVMFLFERITASTVRDERLDAAAHDLAALVTPHADRIASDTLDASDPTGRTAGPG